MPILNCKICLKEFYIKPVHIRLGGGKYCSRLCKVESQKKGEYIPCCICNKLVWKQPKAILHSKSKNLFCSKSCQTIWRNKFYMGPLHHNWKYDENAYRRMMINKIIPICNNCGIFDQRVLVVHHIDHNRKNNRMGNLVWLCRNCHYLIHDRKTL